MADSVEDIQKFQKLFLIIGGLLILGTVMTVAVAYVPFLDVGPRGLSGGDIFVGLIIAITKSSLVALVFMHLFWEKKTLYKFLIFTAFFFGLMFLTLYTLWDPIQQIFLAP